MRSSLAIRLAVAFLLLSALPLVVIAIFVRYNVTDAFINQALEHQREHASILSAQISSLGKEVGVQALVAERKSGHYFASVIDQNGIYIAHPDATQIGRNAKNDFQKDTLRKLLAGGEGAIVEENTNRVIGYSSVPSQGLVAVAVGDHLATIPVMSIEKASFLQLGVSMLIISLAGGGLIWLMVGKPLRQLTKSAEQIGEGNLEIWINPEEMVDELEILANTFNWMAGQLRELFTNLEQRLAELVASKEALQESEQRFRAIIDSVNDAIAVCDPVSGAILDVNDKACEMLGYSREEFRQINPDVWFLGETASLKQNVAQWLEAITKGEPQLFEWRIKDKQGRQFWMELNIKQAIIGGQNRLLVVGRDIDERKQEQAAMIENEKLAGLGTLAAGIAHEIRSPLQIVTGTSETMIKRLQQGERNLERDLHGLESIHRNSWRIAEITNALLTYARPSSQQVEQYDLNVLIRETLPLIEHQLKSSSNISVITNLDPNLPLLNCNRGQISQVLINLLTNARDAMTFGGTITIGTHYLQDDKKIILEVNDTGTGIPEQNQRKIFDPFFTTKPIGQGTGLGLSIVSGIIRAHSGEIFVESKEGFGTRIILSFPESASASDQDNGINRSRFD